MLLTRTPLTCFRRIRSVRLACVRHAASVHPEPGSNSPLTFLCVSFVFTSLLLSCIRRLSLSVRLQYRQEYQPTPNLSTPFFFLFPFSPNSFAIFGIFPGGGCQEGCLSHLSLRLADLLAGSPGCPSVVNLCLLLCMPSTLPITPSSRQVLISEKPTQMEKSLCPLPFKNRC